MLNGLFAKDDEYYFIRFQDHKQNESTCCLESSTSNSCMTKSAIRRGIHDKSSRFSNSLELAEMGRTTERIIEINTFEIKKSKTHYAVKQH